MHFKIGDTVIAISGGVEQTPPLKIIDLQYRGDEIYYKLDEPSQVHWKELIPGNRLTWTLVHLRLGWSVIPIEPGGKRPPISGYNQNNGAEMRYSWKRYQTEKPLESTLLSWWDRWPDMNHAIVCGSLSGVIVLDIDGPEGEKFARENGLPETPMAMTGKGKHIYFKHPGEPVHNFTRKVDGLDLRADGGYVVAPGSWHSEQQKTYRWIKPPWETPLADMPDWLRDLTKETPIQVPEQSVENGPYVTAALEGELGRLARATEGNRNNRLNQSAYSLGQLVGSGALDENEVLRSLSAVAQAIGLNERESEATIRSGLESGKREPRHAPEKGGTLPPLPTELDSKLNKLVQANSDDRLELLDEMADLLSRVDPITVEVYVDKIAKEKLSTKTALRQAVKERAKAQEEKKQDKRPNPTHDELGNRWINLYGGLTIFARGKWQRYQAGVWSPTEIVPKETWDVLIAAKSEGIRPTKNIKASILDYLENKTRKPDKGLDANPSMICLQNGVFDLDQFKLIDFDPSLYLTSKLSFFYDPDADCPLWQEVILDWLSGSKLAVTHLQEAVGYSMTSDIKYQLAWMLAGEGANGKDTFLNVLRYLVGNAHCEIDLSALSVKDSYSLSLLPGKKLVTCSEAVADRDVADVYLKRVISGEPMEARAPYFPPFNFCPICKVWWSVNDKPLVADQTRGFWRRWRVVPFLQNYEGREDYKLGEKLKDELPGIFNWAMIGLKRLYDNNGFTVVPEFDAATEDYRRMTNVTALFVDDACEIGLQFDTPIKDAYAAYKRYCSENGYRYKGKRRFGDDMERLGFARDRSPTLDRTRIFTGLRVKDDLLWD